MKAGMQKFAGSLKMTTKFDLPGGQDRLRQAILYISSKCESAESFGLTKLNKTLWKADFSSYAAREVPVTGRPYQRLPNGPAPVEIPRVLRDMIRDEVITLRPFDFGNGVIEKRPIAHAKANPRMFSAVDKTFLDAAISYYWDLTGEETSDDSHGIAWKSRQDKDPMPYELALLLDAPISATQRAAIIKREIGRQRAR
jgi:hypothetical protein